MHQLQEWTYFTHTHPKRHEGKVEQGKIFESEKSNKKQYKTGIRDYCSRLVFDVAVLVWHNTIFKQRYKILCVLLGFVVCALLFLVFGRFAFIAYEKSIYRLFGGFAQWCLWLFVGCSLFIVFFCNIFFPKTKILFFSLAILFSFLFHFRFVRQTTFHIITHTTQHNARRKTYVEHKYTEKSRDCAKIKKKTRN